MLEVLIGLGIFLTALLFSFSIFPNSHRAAAQARNFTIANTLAKNNLESELRLGYSAIQAKAGVAQPKVPVPSSVIVDGRPTKVVFEVETIVETLAKPTDPVDGCNILSVVRWEEGPFDREVHYETWTTP